MAPHRELWQNPEYRALFEPDEPVSQKDTPIVTVA
jgi:hypothetical protein